MERQACPFCGAWMYYSSPQGDDEPEARYQECHNAYCARTAHRRSFIRRMIDLLAGEQHTSTGQRYRYSKQPGFRVKTREYLIIE